MRGLEPGVPRAREPAAVPLAEHLAQALPIAAPLLFGSRGRSGRSYSALRARPRAAVHH